MLKISEICFINITHKIHNICDKKCANVIVCGLFELSLNI